MYRLSLRPRKMLERSSYCRGWQVRSSTTGRTPNSSSNSKGNGTTDAAASKRASASKASMNSSTRNRSKCRAHDKRPIVAPYQRPPVLIPGAPADATAQQHKPYYSVPNSTRGGGSYRAGYKLPSIHMEALLDPNNYCRKSAFYGGGDPTRHGQSAMRRLLDGKQHALGLLRTQVHQQQPSREPLSYAMFGHGVPPELLQEHLDMADALLSFYGSATGCSFRNVQGKLSVQRIHVKRRTGEKRVLPWPPADNSPGSQDPPEWQYQMDLYLSVMNRLVSTLGLILQSNHQDTPPPTTKAPQGSDDNDFVASVWTKPPTMRYWKAEVVRGTFYPPHLVPPPRGHKGPIPIVEWIPGVGSSAPGNVYVRLQGVATDTSRTKGRSLRRKKRVPVTLVLDAGFRNEPMRASS